MILVIVFELVSPPELRKCRPRDYLNSEIFPTMIPALNQMLRVAKVTEVSKNTSYIQAKTEDINFRKERGLMH